MTDNKIPRLADNYTADAIATRQKFIADKTGVELKLVMSDDFFTETLIRIYIEFALEAI
jgi:hypothetical protein